PRHVDRREPAAGTAARAPASRRRADHHRLRPGRHHLRVRTGDQVHAQSVLPPHRTARVLRRLRRSSPAGRDDDRAAHQPMTIARPLRFLRTPRARLAGFTLLELLIAISVLATVSMIAWRGLDTLVSTRARLEPEGEQVRALLTAFGQLDRDLAQ